MNRLIRIMACAGLLSVLATSPAAAFDHRHAAWTSLLEKHVAWNRAGTASSADYAGFARERGELQRYLQALSAVTRDEFDRWSRDEQLAFLINAYNAFTVELILTEYPDIDSIRELGSLFSSPWKKTFFRLLGEEQHLDGIEHELIRGSGRYDEPLIHFAVNCASIGCPALRDEAFVADRLDAQLLDQTRRFLADRSRNRFDRQANRLEVSSIFDWYEEDFRQGWRGYGSLSDFFAAHAESVADNDADQSVIRGGNIPID